MNISLLSFISRQLLSAWSRFAIAALCLMAGAARAQDFSITSLSTANATVIEVNSLTGDDRGGIAVSGTHVFLTGDSATARFARGSLSGGAGLGVIRDSLVSDLRTEKAYLLADGTTPIAPRGVSGSVVINSLVELDSSTGVPNGTVVTLSSTISVPGNSSSTVGIFAGWSRVVIHNGARVYQIALPSGTVTDLGPLGVPTRTPSESWAYWGVAETIGGVDYLAYVRNGTTVARTKVSDGTVSTIATFANLNDMANFTVLPSMGRWYFHHEGTSQFRVGDETLGFADATMVVPPNPPTIAAQPVSLNVITTEAASFSVAATGAQPMTYQWQKNGVDIVGATSSTLTIASTGAGDAAVYTGSWRTLSAPSPATRLC